MKPRLFIKLGLSIFLAVSAFAFSYPTYANNSFCPKKVATFIGNESAKKASNLLEAAYRDLGCTTEFLLLPAKRGIREFNAGLIDGEVLRLRKVEPHYSRKFIRSSEPLTILVNAIFRNPNIHLDEQTLIGYQAGVIWQESYLLGKNSVNFFNTESMFEAYRTGRLNAFLAATVEVRHANEKAELLPSPVIAKVIAELPIHHYLGTNYKDFMTKLDEHIKQQKKLGKFYIR